MTWIDSNKDFKKSLFVWLQLGKISSSLIAFFFFSSFSLESDFGYVLRLNIASIIMGFSSLFIYRYIDRELRVTHYFSLSLDYLFFFTAIILSKSAYSTLFFWLVCALLVTYFITNKYFTGFILFILVLFTSMWPSPFYEKSDLDYSLYLDGGFQLAFNSSLCILAIFLYLLSYVSEKARDAGSKELFSTVDLLKSEETFLEFNPNPIFEYFEGSEIKARNVLAEEFIKISSEKERDILSNFSQAVLEDGKNHTFQLYFAKNHFLINLVPVSNKVNIYLTNISDLITTQENLRQKEQENYAIIDAIPGFVTWIDRELNYLGVNSKFSEFLNVDKKEFVGKGLGRVHSMEDIELRRLTEELFKNEDVESTSSEINYTHRGSEYWNYININKYNNSQNAVLVSIDTTQLKQSQRKVVEEQKKSEQNAKLAAFGEMSAGIAHEINNPLAVVKASVSRLKKLKSKGTLTPEKIDEMVETIFYGVDRIQRIISGLKNLSRDGKHDLFEKVPLKDIFDDSLVLLGRKCHHEGIDLRLEYEDSLSILCQRVQISQVFVIMINNSIDAISELETKFIHIKASIEDSNILFSLKDSGNGISESIKQKIFHPFFTTKGVGKGTGLGLSLASKIIEAHSGQLRISSDSDNTEFIISIPHGLS